MGLYGRRIEKVIREQRAQRIARGEPGTPKGSHSIPTKPQMSDDEKFIKHALEIEYGLVNNMKELSGPVIQSEFNQDGMQCEKEGDECRRKFKYYAFREDMLESTIENLVKQGTKIITKELYDKIQKDEKCVDICYKLLKVLSEAKGTTGVTPATLDELTTEIDDNVFKQCSSLSRTIINTKYRLHLYKKSSKNRLAAVTSGNDTMEQSFNANTQATSDQAQRFLGDDGSEQLQINPTTISPEDIQQSADIVQLMDDILKETENDHHKFQINVKLGNVGISIDELAKSLEELKKTNKNPEDTSSFRTFADQMAFESEQIQGQLWELLDDIKKLKVADQTIQVKRVDKLRETVRGTINAASQQLQKSFIRQKNILIHNINGIKDLSREEKKELVESGQLARIIYDFSEESVEGEIGHLVHGFISSIKPTELEALKKKLQEICQLKNLNDRFSSKEGQFDKLRRKIDTKLWRERKRQAGHVEGSDVPEPGPPRKLSKRGTPN